MCGIVGYIGPNQAARYLIEGLTKLEYRGYDSSGIAVLKDDEITVEKSVGRLKELEDKMAGHEPKGFLGIGHTRWATHGRPSDENAHPHCSEHGKFVVVHNGIIENYMALKEELLKKGYTFKSETDTEVVPQLLEDLYDGNFLETVKKVLKKLEGSFALGIICKDYKDEIICAKKDNPLVIGLGDGENFIASDIPAIINYTRKTYILEDGEMAIIKKDSVVVMDFDGNTVPKEVFEISWNAEAAEKGGYAHFMLKEIHEQPKAVKATLSPRVSKDLKKVILDELNWSKLDVEKFNKVYIVACGTAYHAGMVGKYYIEKLARIPVEVDIASEFRYRDPIIDENTLMIVLSQSGETSDTLAALKEAKRLNATTLAITNVVGSSIAREADNVIYTWAGPEIAVASTKAYTTQLVTMFLFALYVANLKGKIADNKVASLLEELSKLPEELKELLKDDEKIKEMAKTIAKKDNMFYIGRSLDYDVALEGALKIKEISYIHAEAYAAGELKHGTLALIEENIPVIALATQKSVYEKTLSNIKEVKARDAYIIGIAASGDTELHKYVDDVLTVPNTDELLIPLLTVVPLQLLAYHAAIYRNCDVDKPRNLAKSVTVE